MPILFLATAALAHPPDAPDLCFDSVLIDAVGIGDEPTCWFVDGNGDYASPEVVEGDLRIVELPDGRVRARCVAPVANDHGHLVRWDATNACATDPEALCEIGLDDGTNVSTAVWRLTVGPAGLATLSCVYTP